MDQLACPGGTSSGTDRPTTRRERVTDQAEEDAAKDTGALFPPVFHCVSTPKRRQNERTTPPKGRAGPRAQATSNPGLRSKIQPASTGTGGAGRALQNLLTKPRKKE